MSPVLWLLLLAPPAGPPAPAETALPGALGGPVVVAPAALRATDGAPLKLTLQDALRLGLERDRLVRIGKLDSLAARGAATVAGAGYQPNLELNADYSRFNSARQGFSSGAAGADASHSVSVRVEQLIFDTAQTILDIQRTRREARAAEYREVQTQLDAAGRISGDFFDAVRGAALRALAQQLVDLSGRQLEQAQARFETGTGARLEVTRAEVSLANARVELQNSANQYRDALARLRYDLVVPPGTPLEVTDDAGVPPVDLSLDEALTAARRERPSLHAAAATAQARRSALTSATLSRWVRLEISASYEKFLESSRNVTDEYVIGGLVAVPLFDGQAGEARETQAQAAYQRAAEEYQRQVDSAALEIEQAHLTWSDAVERLAAAESAVALARRTLDQTEDSFRLGISSLLEVSDARAEYARAETNRIQARLDRDLSGVRLRLAVGRLPLTKETAGE